MDDSIFETICFYLALDYPRLKKFVQNWISVRGLVKNIDFKIPTAPRVFISKALLDIRDRSFCRFNYGSDSSFSTFDEVFVCDEDNRSSLYLSNDNLNESNLGIVEEPISVLDKMRMTPDIVRTIKLNPPKFDELTDAGFFSEITAPENESTIKKLEELQKQFDEMQRNIADLVLLNMRNSAFQPSVTSSPLPQMSRFVCETPHPPHAPPPPCAPPPPPPPPTPLCILKSGSKAKVPAGMPDMSEVLKGIASVKLRPVKHEHEGNKPSDSKFSLQYRLCSKNRSNHEGVIATALREQFRRYRMFHTDEDTEGTIPPSEHTSVSGISNGSDLWTDNSNGFAGARDHEQLNNSSSIIGRAMLRRVDRNKLPERVVSELNIEDGEN